MRKQIGCIDVQGERYVARIEQTIFQKVTQKSGEDCNRGAAKTDRVSLDIQKARSRMLINHNASSV